MLWRGKKLPIYQGLTSHDKCKNSKVIILLAVKLIEAH